ncbi:hypothetical protein V6N13_071549 [Hibiscus sabdariffa]
MAYTLMANFAKYRHHLSMVVVQILSSIVYFITEAAFNEGLNTYVYVSYRFLLAGLLLFPVAYFIERICLTFIMFFVSMRCTSPTFVAAVYNTVSSLTFLIAILFRMEVVDVRSHRGMAKILGTLISLLGVTVITLYKGPALQNMWGTPIHMKRLSIHENWVKGSILTIASCITLSSWYIMQTFTMRKYPAELSLTAWISFIGGTQSAVFTVLVQHKPGVWSINMLGIDFWAITYCGIIGSGLLIFIQLWCMKEKGPVFVSMFNPLQTVIVAVLAYFVFGEKMYTGSILGGVTVIIGLYLLLWGKDKDETYTKSQELPSSHSLELKVPKSEEVAAALKVEP